MYHKPKRMEARFPGTCTKCKSRIQPKQLIWWARGAGASHVECPPKQEILPKDNVDLTPVIAFLKAAKERGLKRPKLRVLDETGTSELLLTLTVKGMEPGSVAVRRGFEYIGVVRPNGNVYGGRFTPALASHLAVVAGDPASAAKRFSALMGRCSFCNAAITDEGSVEVGYGPICAKRWGLPHHPKGSTILRNPATVNELLTLPEAR